MEIDIKEYNALDRLRGEKISFPARQIKEILMKYYPSGTTVTINKDFWKIEKPEQ